MTVCPRCSPALPSTIVTRHPRQKRLVPICSTHGANRESSEFRPAYSDTHAVSKGTVKKRGAYRDQSNDRQYRQRALRHGELVKHSHVDLQFQAAISLKELGPRGR